MVAAIYGLVGRAQRSELEKMGYSLRHRGTHETIWSPRTGVTLGTREREGFAPEGAAANLPIAFAGTITNRREIVSRLRRAAPLAPRFNDAQLAWHLYCALGPESFALLNGPFAMALLEPRSGALVLAVDRWATQPLYLAAIADRWAFATEYKALLTLDELNRRVSTRVAGCVQASKYLPSRMGLLEDVLVIAPGEYVRVTGGTHEAAAYPTLKLEVSDGRTEEDLACELRDCLLEGARRLVGPFNRVGVAISAGLDSAVTLGAVRAVAPRLLIYTYTVSFDPRDPDLKLAAEAASYFGAVHREIILAPEDLPSLLPELLWRMEDPVGREEMVVYLAMTQRAAADVPILLYGHMADVLFGGMPRHRLIKTAGDVPLLREAITQFYDYTQTGAAPQSWLGKLLVAGYYRGRQNPPPRSTAPAPASAAERLRLTAREPLNNALLAAARCPTEVASMERLHAWAGMRFGSIFHDRDVAQCAFRVPDRLKIRGLTCKYILRRAAAGILPPQFAARPKGLIRIGRSARVRRVMEGMAADLLEPRCVAARGLFDPQDVERLRSALRTGGCTEEQLYHLWTLLLIEIWCRIFIDGRRPLLLAAAPEAVDCVQSLRGGTAEGG